MTDSVACRKLICVRPTGEEIVVTMTVGKPYLLSGMARCPVSLDPLHERLPDIGGEDSWQALQLAMRLVEELLHAEVEKGSKLFWPQDDGTRSEYDLEC